MANEGKSIYQSLSELDMTGKHKEKNHLTYLPWASAWAAVKAIYPDAVFDVVRSPEGNRYWTDGKTCSVQTYVSIDGLVQKETLAVMDHRNQSIPVDAITSTAVDKSIRRCLTKNLALFGLDLNLWIGEELSDEAKARIDEEEEAKQLALDEKIQEISKSGQELIGSGIEKAVIVDIVAKYNGGNKNPNSIKDIAVCEKILAEFKKLVNGGKDKDE